MLLVLFPAITKNILQSYNLLPLLYFEVHNASYSK